MIPTLHANRVTLSPFTVDDAFLVQKYAGAAEVARTTMNIPHPYPDGAADSWIASHLTEYLEKKNVVFAIRSATTGELYGAINLGLNMPHQNGELGYWMGVPFWNKGFCTEAARRLIEYGFQDIGLNKICSRHLAGNLASGRVMEKSGMRKEGVLRQQMIKDGIPLDIVEYGILKSEYQNG